MCSARFLMKGKNMNDKKKEDTVVQVGVNVNFTTDEHEREKRKLEEDRILFWCD